MAKKAQVRKDPSDLQMKLGAVVRICRRQMGISQEELAWRANLHRTYIADIERGARNVTLRSIANLASALQVTVANLLSAATASARRTSFETASVDGGEILLVEDCATDAAMTVRAFKRANISNPIRRVRDAEAAVDYCFGVGRRAKLPPAHPQLILLDLNLPRMSGLEFLQRLKSDERTRGIPVVVLTVSRSDRMILDCARLGAENFIVKPVDIENFARITPKLNLRLTLAPFAGVRNTAGYI